MPAEAIGQAQRLFEVDRSRRRQADGTRQRFGRDIDKKTAVLPVDHRQADAVAGDRIARTDVVESELAGVDRQADGCGAVITRE
jgi:hypothetical protein